jgi:hypothetical protein
MIFEMLLRWKSMRYLTRCIYNVVLAIDSAFDNTNTLKNDIVG